MSTKTYVTDDLTGQIDNTANAVEITFSSGDIAEKTYSLDLGIASAYAVTAWLNDGNTKPLLKLLTADTTAKPSKPAAKTGNGNLTAARTWARANGYSVGDKGRINGEIMAAYEASLVA